MYCHEKHDGCIMCSRIYCPSRAPEMVADIVWLCVTQSFLLYGFLSSLVILRICYGFIVLFRVLSFPAVSFAFNLNNFLFTLKFSFEGYRNANKFPRRIKYGNHCLIRCIYSLKNNF